MYIETQTLADLISLAIGVFLGVLVGPIIGMWVMHYVEKMTENAKMRVRHWLRILAFALLSVLGGWGVWDTANYSFIRAVEVTSPLLLLIGLWGVRRSIKK